MTTAPSSDLWSRYGGRRAGAAAFSGLLAAQAFPSADLAPLAWVALIPLLAVLCHDAPDVGAWHGFLQGVVFYLVLLSWIPQVVAGYGGLGLALGWLVGLLLVVVLAGFHALFGAWQAWLHGRLGLAALLAAPAGWVLLAEGLRNWPLGGFPWGFLGYSQHGIPGMLRLAPWIGVSGLSLVLVGFSALSVAAFSPGKRAIWRRTGLLLVALILVLVLLPAWPLPPAAGEPLTVAAIQGDVRQDEKWQDSRRVEILDRHLDLTRRALAGGARLILWPESSTVEQLSESPALRARLGNLLRPSGARAIVGSVYRLPGGGYTNAAFLVDSQGSLLERYDKVHLVPFGETVPLAGLLFFVKPLVEAVGDFRPGKTVGLMGHDLDLRRSTVARSGAGEATPFGMSICYEIIYGSMVAEQVRRGATFLTTITNDAWFGRTAAPAQHFAMAVLRAAETRRWLVRSANTGISGLVAPDGRVVQATGLFVPALVQGTLVPRRDLTFYVRYPQALSQACVMILLLAAALAAFWNPHGHAGRLPKPSR
ncbi:MAG: apolipoprotein N-acyltransferase [Acidobacteria bacterium]|nr:MAG: apolipoprotein N-acyltransferase [Acidobacteriota bacterium]